MKKNLMLFLLIAYSIKAISQVGINTDGSAPASSAMLDVKSPNKGVLITRLDSKARKAIASPAAGLLVYDTDEQTIYMWDGLRWLGFQPMSDEARPANNLTFPPDTQDTLYTGYAVSIWDQFAVVGAPLRTSNGQAYAGGAYVYKKSGSKWQLFTTLVPTSGAIDTAEFGVSVNVCGNYMIIGAVAHKNGANQRVGAAYIYYYNGSAWVNTQVIFGTTIGNGYAQAVDINQYGTYAAVSETDALAGGVKAGVVRIYQGISPPLALQFTLQDPVPVVSESFGSAMSMSPLGDYVLVGAPNKTVSGHPGNGYIGLFRRSGSSWSQFQTYTPVSQDYLHIGAATDVTDSYATLSTGGVNKVSYNDIPAVGLWGGSEASEFPDGVNGVAIDPVSQKPYVFHGNSISDQPSPNVKIKSISAGNPISLPQSFSVYNKDYIIGLPFEGNINGSYTGAVYFGILP